MTDIQVLLDNIRAVAVACASTLLGLWAIYYFFKNLFGEAGRHARAAVGVAVLPLGASVEADAIVAVRPA